MKHVDGFQEWNCMIGDKYMVILALLHQSTAGTYVDSTRRIRMCNVDLIKGGVVSTQDSSLRQKRLQSSMSRNNWVLMPIGEDVHRGFHGFLCLTVKLRRSSCVAMR